MELNGLLDKLRLEHLGAQLDAVCEQAAQHEVDYKTFLAQALQTEWQGRHLRGIETRLKQARLPWIKTLEQFDFDFQPSLDRRQVRELAGLGANSFTLYVQEAPGQNGTHATETVSYVVLEAGSWALPDGRRLEVGKVITSATVGVASPAWATVSYGAAFGAAPVVVSQVQGDADGHWVKTRQRNVGAGGFEVALEEDDAQTAPHGSETIGWLALEGGSGTWNGKAYRAASTSDSVTHVWYTESFGGAFSAAPQLIGGVATYDDGDGAYLRYRSLESGSVQLKIEEDKTQDSETNHATEVVGYLAIEGSGTLTAQGQAAPAEVRKTYTFGGQRVAVRVNGTLSYLYSDHLGSASLATNADGNVTAEMRYYPYGETRWSTGTMPTDRRFTGQREESYTQLYDFQARYYDPRLGRFLQADTIVPSPQSPQSFNRFMYCVGNPMRFVDPTGHYSEEEIMQAFGVQTWDEVLAFFGGGGRLGGLWGWLEVLRRAQNGDFVSHDLDLQNPWPAGALYDVSGPTNGGYFWRDQEGHISVGGKNHENFALGPGNTERLQYSLFRPDSLMPRIFEPVFRTWADTRYSHLDPSKVDWVDATLDIAGILLDTVGGLAGRELSAGANAVQVMIKANAIGLTLDIGGVIFGTGKGLYGDARLTQEEVGDIELSLIGIGLPFIPDSFSLYKNLRGAIGP